MPLKRDTPTVQNVRKLPTDFTIVVPKEWEDQNGHVNVQHYFGLYDLGGWQMMTRLGFDDDYRAKNMSGIFDLENHITYHAEISIGDTVSVHNRLLDCNNKFLQGMFFVVNDTQDKLAAYIEYLSVHVDMKTRRSASFQKDFSSKLAELRSQHSALDWAAPVCGLYSL